MLSSLLFQSFVFLNFPSQTTHFSAFLGGLRQLIFIMKVWELEIKLEINIRKYIQQMKKNYDSNIVDEHGGTGADHESTPSAQRKSNSNIAF